MSSVPAITGFAVSVADDLAEKQVTMATVAAITCLSAFLTGTAVVVLGCVKSQLGQRRQLTETQTGGLVAAFNVALIPLMLAAGLLVDTLGVRPLLIISLLLLAVAFFSLTFRGGFLSALGYTQLAGVGTAGLFVSSVFLMQLLGRDFHDPVAALNFGFVFVALGMILAPTLGDLLLRALDLRRSLALLSLVCLGAALGTALAFRDPLPETLRPPSQLPNLGTVWTDPRVWLVGLALLLYAPLECAVGIWGTTFLRVDQGFGERRAARWMSAFWLAFLASRLAVAMLLLRFHWGQSLAAPFPFLLAALTAVVVGNLAGGTPRPLGAAQGLVCLGLVLGPIVPTLLAVGLQTESPFLGQLLSHPAPGTTFGALFAIGSLGSLFLAPLIGASVRDGSVQKTFRLLSPLVLLLLIATLAIWLR